jgi:hypothetical protein
MMAKNASIGKNPNVVSTFSNLCLVFCCKSMSNLRGLALKTRWYSPWDTCMAKTTTLPGNCPKCLKARADMDLATGAHVCECGSKPICDTSSSIGSTTITRIGHKGGSI